MYRVQSYFYLFLFTYNKILAKTLFQLILFNININNGGTVINKPKTTWLLKVTVETSDDETVVTAICINPNTAGCYDATPISM